jgi:hypothetical protein
MLFTCAVQAPCLLDIDPWQGAGFGLLLSIPKGFALTDKDNHVFQAEFIFF